MQKNFGKSRIKYHSNYHFPKVSRQIISRFLSMVRANLLGDRLVFLFTHYWRKEGSIAQ